MIELLTGGVGQPLRSAATRSGQNVLRERFRGTHSRPGHVGLRQDARSQHPQPLAREPGNILLPVLFMRSSPERLVRTIESRPTGHGLASGYETNPVVANRRVMLTQLAGHQVCRFQIRASSIIINKQ